VKFVALDKLCKGWEREKARSCPKGRWTRN